MKELLEQVAAVVADYRAGELPILDADHMAVGRRSSKKGIRSPLLIEMAHVLGRTYLSRTQCERFLRRVATSGKLAGDDPTSFWEGASILRIQQGG